MGTMTKSGTTQPAYPKTLPRRLGLLDATMIVAGSMIGSGIFITSADISRQVRSASLLLLVWVFTALVTVAGARLQLAMTFLRAGAGTSTCARPGRPGASCTAGPSSS